MYSLPQPKHLSTHCLCKIGSWLKQTLASQHQSCFFPSPSPVGDLFLHASPAPRNLSATSFGDEKRGIQIRIRLASAFRFPRSDQQRHRGGFFRKHLDFLIGNHSCHILEKAHCDGYSKRNTRVFLTISTHLSLTKMRFLTTLLPLLPLTTAQSDIPLSPPLTSILSNAFQSPLYTYPTSLTQGIIPKNLHSHNDYWRPLPFYSALSVGAISVEADVWLFNDVLHVGHEAAALTEERTFDSLYVQPILDVLKRQNPSSEFVDAYEEATGGEASKNGVYDTSAGQTLYLYVDLKTPGAETFPAVVDALEPLRSAGYLTTFNGTGVTPGPVTVIGTGNTPLDQVQGVEPRDYFYDASLPELDTTFANITSDVSLTANTAFSETFGEMKGLEFNASQAETLRQQVESAHGKGLLVRYWVCDVHGFVVYVWRGMSKC